MAGPQGTQGSHGNFKDKAEGTGAQMGAAAGRKVGEAAERAQQSASSTAQRAQDLASNVTQQAKDVASNVAGKAQEYASTAANKAEDALSSVGDRMSSWGHQLRETAPREGVLGSTASSVAGTLESGGRYLQQHGFNDMTDDLSAVVRHYPIQSLLLAFGIGCFLGMASRR
jgi:cell division septum initiation protein DivIVA